jgi:hypothetical protein
MRDTLRGCSVPIPAEQTLSVFEISKYWSSQIKHAASPQELRDEIGKAWWRGELIAANGSSRLSVLRGYYLRSVHFVAFAFPNAEEPAQWESVGEGVIEFVRPLRVPLPNAKPDTWTEANCAPAFDAIARGWKEDISPSAPTFLDIVLTSSEFFRWVGASGYERPTFWSCPIEEQSEQSGPLDSTIPTIQITKVQPKSVKSRAAWQAIDALWPNGPSAILKTADIHRSVNKWIQKQPRTKYPFTEVSREVVARLLERK